MGHHHARGSVVGRISHHLGVRGHAVRRRRPAGRDCRTACRVLPCIGRPCRSLHLVGDHVGVGRVGGEQRHIALGRHRERRAAQRRLDDVGLGVVGKFAHGASFKKSKSGGKVEDYAAARDVLGLPTLVGATATVALISMPKALANAP